MVQYSNGITVYGRENVGWQKNTKKHLGRRHYKMNSDILWAKVGTSYQNVVNGLLKTAQEY